MSAELYELLRQSIADGETINTLSGGKPNTVVAIDRSGVLVSTLSSQVKGRGPQMIPPWMFQRAWDHLVANGSLTAAELVSSDGLNVKRSAAVLAMLARVPGVEVVTTRPIELRYQRAARRRWWRLR